MEEGMRKEDERKEAKLVKSIVGYQGELWVVFV